MPADSADPVPEAPSASVAGAAVDDEWVDQSEWVDDVAVAEPLGDAASEALGGGGGAEPTAREVRAEPIGAVATVSRATRPEPTAAQPLSDEPHVELEPAAPVLESAPPQRNRIGFTAIAFGAAIVLLTAAIPVLTWVGYHLAVTSRGGVIRGASPAPGAGATEVVPPTPTELVVFSDARGRPVSYSLLTLNQGAHGGAVVSIPATTKLPVPAYGLIRLDVAYAFGGLRTLQQSLTSVVDFTPGGDVRIGPGEAAALVRPLGQLTVDNPVAVYGRERFFASGQLRLPVSEVEDYLAATSSADPLAPMKTQQAFWRGWLAASAADPSAAQAAAHLNPRLGHFAQVMATGGVRYDTLPVTARTASDPNRGSIDVFTIDQAAARLQLLGAVPFPMAPTELRPQVELYNGYNGQGVAPAIMQRVVFAGGQLLLVGSSGNAERKTTELHYGDPSMVPEVEKLRAALGTGKLVLDPTIAEPGEVTIILGKDVIAHPPAMLVGARG